MIKKIHAPWSDEQVNGLNRYQRRGGFHAFTCGGDRGTLVADAAGWTCPVCDYRQSWAWEFMTGDAP